MNKIGVVIICARAGSKTLKNKNIKKINNIELVGWSILVGKKIRCIKKIIISSDSKKIIDISKKYGALAPFVRPKRLSTSKANEYEVWKHAIKKIIKIYNFKPDFIISLPPTCPTRSTKDINKALYFFLKQNYDGVVSICESNRNPYFNIVKRNILTKKISIFSKIYNIYRRQDAPKTFDITTAFYIAKTNYILNSKSFLSGKIAGYLIKKKNGIDIDDIYDFNLSKIILENKIEK